MVVPTHPSVQRWHAACASCTLRRAPPRPRACKEARLVPAVPTRPRTVPRARLERRADPVPRARLGRRADPPSARLGRVQVGGRPRAPGEAGVVARRERRPARVFVQLAYLRTKQPPAAPHSRARRRRRPPAAPRHARAARRRWSHFARRRARGGYLQQHRAVRVAPRATRAPVAAIGTIGAIGASAAKERFSPVRRADEHAQRRPPRAAARGAEAVHQERPVVCAEPPAVEELERAEARAARAQRAVREREERLHAQQRQVLRREGVSVQ